MRANLAMMNLYCNDNQLTTLEMFGNTTLERVYINGNQFTGEALNEIMTNLRSNTVGNFESRGWFIDISRNPGTNDSMTVLARIKGWTVKSN